jgi:hypothetical protein
MSYINSDGLKCKFLNFQKMNEYFNRNNSLKENNLVEKCFVKSIQWRRLIPASEPESPLLYPPELSFPRKRETSRLNHLFMQISP